MIERLIDSATGIGAGGRQETATRSGRSTGATRANSGRPVSTDNARAASATVVAIGPYRVIPNQCGSPLRMVAGSRSAPGRMPTTPLAAAGIRTEPSPSEASASATVPAATAAPEPPDAPPALRPRAHGDTVVPSGSSDVPQMDNSGHRV